MHPFLEQFENITDLFMDKHFLMVENVIVFLCTTSRQFSAEVMGERGNDRVP